MIFFNGVCWIFQNSNKSVPITEQEIETKRVEWATKSQSHCQNTGNCHWQVTQESVEQNSRNFRDTGKVGLPWIQETDSKGE